MLKVGDRLPAATLYEYVEVEGNGCSIGPNPVDVSQAMAGKSIAIFGLPGASRPPVRRSTCRVTFNWPNSSAKRESTRSGASRSTTPS